MDTSRVIYTSQEDYDERQWLKFKLVGIFVIIGIIAVIINDISLSYELDNSASFTILLVVVGLIFIAYKVLSGKKKKGKKNRGRKNRRRNKGRSGSRNRRF